MLIIFLAIFVAVSAKRCAEYGVNYAGHDIEIVPNIQHWMDCAISCQGNIIPKGCDSWTWNLSNKNCYLKSSDEGRRIDSKPVQISGGWFCTSEC